MVQNPEDDPRIYAALAMPNTALANGGVEILRAGIIDDALHVQARRAFKNPKQWGEVLADVALRVAGLYAEETRRTREDVTAAIRDAFLAGTGAPAPQARRSPTATKRAATTKRASTARKAAAKTAGKTTRKITPKTKRKR